MYEKEYMRMLKEDLRHLSDILAPGSPAKGHLGCAVFHVEAIEKELENDN